MKNFATSGHGNSVLLGAVFQIRLWADEKE